jgi:hypothetical protein
MSGQILCQFKNENGEFLGAPIDIPMDIDKLSLEKLCQALISAVRRKYKKLNCLKIIIWALINANILGNARRD